MTEYNDQGNRRYEGEFGGSLNKGIYWKGKGTQYSENGRSVLYDGQWNNGIRKGKWTSNLQWILGKECAEWRGNVIRRQWNEAVFWTLEEWVFECWWKEVGGL